MAISEETSLSKTSENTGKLVNTVAYLSAVTSNKNFVFKRNRCQ